MKTAPSVVGPLGDGPVGKCCFNVRIDALGFPQLTAILTRNLIYHNSNQNTKLYFSKYFRNISEYSEIIIESKSAYANKQRRW